MASHSMMLSRIFCLGLILSCGVPGVCDTGSSPQPSASSQSNIAAAPLPSFDAAVLTAETALNSGNPSEAGTAIKPFLALTNLDNSRRISVEYLQFEADRVSGNFADAHSVAAQIQSQFDDGTDVAPWVHAITEDVGDIDRYFITPLMGNTADLTKRAASESDRARKSMLEGQIALATQDRPGAAIDFTGAYKAEKGDIDLTEREQFVIETGYLDALMISKDEGRAVKLRELAYNLLGDSTVNVFRKRLGFRAAAALLGYNLGIPDNSKVEDIAKSVTNVISAPTAQWRPKLQGAFVMCLAQDLQGRVYVGTEDNGIWRQSPDNPLVWQNFTTADGLGDNVAYAMVCDRLGRIWVGHQSHGVSIYNGETWKNYGPEDGPGGERVFAMATSPVDGDVWIATNNGLTRYDLLKKTWIPYTNLEGLYSDHAVALAFAQDGTLYVGTECDGLVIGTPQDGYKTWRHVSSSYGREPLSPGGIGLPSNMITAVLVTHDGGVWVGTTDGLAQSHDHGKHWRFLRGEDWEDKVRGLYKAPDPIETDTHGFSLLEDYVSCLTQDQFGFLYIGYRSRGFEIVDTHTGERVYPLSGDPKNELYMSSLLPISKGYVLLGRYGDGLQQRLPQGSPAYKMRYAGVDLFGKSAAGNSSTIATDVVPDFPPVAPPPSLDDLREMLRIVHEACKPKSDSARVAVLPDDWRTKGDWLGRYGRFWACLNAMCSPSDYTWGAGWEPVDYNARVGHGGDPGETLRYWVHWLYTTNINSLEMPPTYLHSRVYYHLTTWGVNRRQSEQDDHGEVYPLWREGPDLFWNLSVPEGDYYLSLYDFNKDGHDGQNRYRDYRISIKLHSQGKPLDYIEGFNDEPELAHARLRNFWGGVYKRFLVRGPVTLTIKIDRNFSWDTILAAVMLDRLDEEPAPYFCSVDDFNNIDAANRRQAVDDGSSTLPSTTSGDDTADRLMTELQNVRYDNPIWWAANKERFYQPLLRWYREKLQSLPAGHEPDVSITKRLGTCYYECHLFREWEDCEKKCGLITARELEKALRWDGISSEGDEFSVLNGYLNSHHIGQLSKIAGEPSRQN